MSVTSHGVTLKERNEEVVLIKEWEHSAKERWKLWLKSAEGRRTKGCLSERKTSLRGKHRRTDERRRDRKDVQSRPIYLYKKISSEEFQGECVNRYTHTEIGYTLFCK